MSQGTKIEWTRAPGYIPATWNPLRGCTRVSEGCRNCYAERMAARLSGPGRPYDGLVRSTPDGPRWMGNVALVPALLDEPFRWRKPRMVFVNSMSDLFHAAVPFEFVDEVFGRMALADRHIFQILTKRPKRMLEYFSRPVEQWSAPIVHWRDALNAWPLRNVWLGVSVEDQRTADERIPLLLQTPAAVRFVSAEPLLGPIDLSRYLFAAGDDGEPAPRNEPFLPCLHWVIVGGESGPGARPMHPDWVRSIRDQCIEAGVPVFVKQMGAVWAKEHGADGKGGDWNYWPADLRVREFPDAYQGTTSEAFGRAR